MSPIGESWTPDGRFSVAERSSLEGLWCWEGKTVERVAIEESLRIRRACTVDSCTVGILKSVFEDSEGLANICCGARSEPETAKGSRRTERD